jgi:hypothetical protein
MTHVKPQISKFKAEPPRRLVKRALMCYGGTTHERLLSESSLSYRLAYLLIYNVLKIKRNALYGFHNFQAGRE